MTLEQRRRCLGQTLPTAKAVRGALLKASRQPGFAVAQVVGIGVGGTGSSPLPVDAQYRALAMLLKWQKNLHAQCWLWKDHTSWREAARITELAAKHRPRGRALLRRNLPTGLREAHDKPRVGMHVGSSGPMPI